MTEKIKIVTLLKSGPAWLPEYVYRLHRAVDRHLNVPHEFICLTDIELGVRTLSLVPMPEIDNNDIPKFWYKVQLIHPDVNSNSGLNSCTIFQNSGIKCSYLGRNWN